jgi:cytochrome P450
MSGRPSAYPVDTIWSVRRTRQDPAMFLQTLATHGDLVRFSLAGRPAFLLNHPDLVEDVLVVNHARFAKPSALQRSAMLFGTGLLTAEGELHQRRRRIAQPAFGPQRMSRYGATILDASARVNDRWRDGETIDMAAEMHGLTMRIVGWLLFGVDLSAQAHEIGRALTEVAASIDPLLSLLAPTRRLRPAAHYLRTLVDRLIDEHVASGQDGDDMLSLLRRSEGSEQEPVETQLRDDVLTLFVAGHDTIANGLIWTWHLLALHPDAERRLREELGRVLDGSPPVFEQLKDLTYTGWALAESLRLYPPSWVLTRRALADHRVGGTLIPAGAIVIVSQYLLHRDERFFPDPLEFDPGRWDAPRQAARPRLAYFPFGAGPRSCIGQGIATLEGVLLLASLAQRWRPVPVGPIATDRRATLRPWGPALMRLERVGLAAES